jgi:hypothetical protein
MSKLPVVALCLLAAPWAVTMAAAQSNPFDGTYTGLATSSSGGQCVASFRRSLTLKDGMGVLAWNGSLEYKVNVAPNGAIHDEEMSHLRTPFTAKLDGKIENGVATLTSDTQFCHYQVVLKKG